MSSSEELDRAINDPAEWGTPQRGRKSEKRQRGAVVSVRMTEEELLKVQERAARSGQTVGAFMREAALGSDDAESRTNLFVTKVSAHAFNQPPLNVVADYSFLPTADRQHLFWHQPWLQSTENRSTA
jgi:hypothetical protein